MLKIVLMLMGSAFLAIWACAKPLPPEAPPATLAEASRAWSEFLHGPTLSPTDCSLDDLGPTFTCIPLAGQRGYFVGALAYHNDSFGCAAVFTVRRGHVDKTWWIENCDCAVYSIRCVTLSGPAHPFIELISCTGHGNGSVQLYSFEHEHLKLALETRAYDDHDDGMILDSPRADGPGILDRTYKDLDGDGFDDALLTGWAISSSDEKCNDLRNKWERREPVQKAFAFAPEAGDFVELIEWRLGPDVYHDEDTWRAIQLTR